MEIRKNKSKYKEEIFEDIYNEGRSSDIDTTIEDLPERNKNMNEEMKVLKREYEIMSIRLCEVTKQKKNIEDEKDGIEEDKRKIIARLDENIIEVQTLEHNKFDMVNQLLGAIQENTRKELEIINLNLRMID